MSTTKHKKRGLFAFFTSPFDKSKRKNASAGASVRASSRPMATSSDIILTSRHHSHSLTDLTTHDLRTTPDPHHHHTVDIATDTKPGRLNGNADGDGDVNVAACYGIDTVHSWASATVSAGSGLALKHGQLSGWRSDVDLHSRMAQTVSLDTSPVVEVHKPADHGGSAGVGASHNGLVQTTHEAPVLDTPIPPPRIKRKARAPLPSKFNASVHNEPGDVNKTLANQHQQKPCEFVAPPPPLGNPQHPRTDVVDDVTQVYLTKRDSLTSNCSQYSSTDDDDEHDVRVSDDVTDDVIVKAELDDSALAALAEMTPPVDDLVKSSTVSDVELTNLAVDFRESRDRKRTTSHDYEEDIGDMVLVGGDTSPGGGVESEGSDVNGGTMVDANRRAEFVVDSVEDEVSNVVTVTDTTAVSKTVAESVSDSATEVQITAAVAETVSDSDSNSDVVTVVEDTASIQSCEMDADGGWLRARVEPEGACCDDEAVNGDRLFITQKSHHIDDGDDDDDNVVDVRSSVLAQNTVPHLTQNAVVIVQPDNNSVFHQTTTTANATTTTTTADDLPSAGEMQSSFWLESDDEVTVVPLPKLKRRPDLPPVAEDKTPEQSESDVLPLSTDVNSPVEVHDVAECDRERLPVLVGQESHDVDISTRTSSDSENTDDDFTHDADVTSDRDYISHVNQRHDQTASQTLHAHSEIADKPASQTGLEIDSDDDDVIMLPLPKRRQEVDESFVGASVLSQTFSSVTHVSTVPGASSTNYTAHETVTDTSALELADDFSSVSCDSSSVSESRIDAVTVVQSRQTVAETVADSVSGAGPVVELEVIPAAVEKVFDSNAVTVVQHSPTVAETVSDPVSGTVRVEYDTPAIAETVADSAQVAEVTPASTETVSDSVAQDTPAVAVTIAGSVADNSDADDVTVVSEVTPTVAGNALNSETVTVVKITAMVSETVANSVSDTATIEQDAAAAIATSAADNSNSHAVTVVHVSRTVVENVLDSDAVTAMQNTPEIPEIVLDSASNAIAVVQDTSVVADSCSDAATVAQDSPVVSRTVPDPVLNTEAVMHEIPIVSETVADLVVDRLTVHCVADADTSSCVSDDSSFSAETVIAMDEKTSVESELTEETAENAAADAAANNDGEKVNQSNDSNNNRCADSTNAAEVGGDGSQQKTGELITGSAASDDDAKYEHISCKDDTTTSLSGDVFLKSVASNDTTHAPRILQDVVTSEMSTKLGFSPGISCDNNEKEAQEVTADVVGKGADDLVTSRVSTDLRSSTEDLQNSHDWASTDEHSVSVPLPRSWKDAKLTVAELSVNDHPVTEHSVAINTVKAVDDVDSTQNGVHHDATGSKLIGDHLPDKETEVESPVSERSESKRRENEKPESVERQSDGGEKSRHVILIRQNFEQLQQQQQRREAATTRGDEERKVDEKSQATKLADVSVAYGVSVTPTGDSHGVDSVKERHQYYQVTASDNQSTVTTHIAASVKSDDVNIRSSPVEQNTKSEELLLPQVTATDRSHQLSLTTNEHSSVLAEEKHVCLEVSQVNSCEPNAADEQISTSQPKQVHALPNDEKRPFQDAEKTDRRHRSSTGEVKFARASELARRYESLTAAAAASNVTHKSAVRRNASAPSTTHLPNKSVTLSTATNSTPATTSIVMGSVSAGTTGDVSGTTETMVIKTTETTSDTALTNEGTVLTAGVISGTKVTTSGAIENSEAITETTETTSGMLTKGTKLDTANTDDRHSGLRRAKSDNQKSSVSRSDQNYQQQPDDKNGHSGSGTRQAGPVPSTGRGLQFVQRAKSVVLVSQTGGRQTEKAHESKVENGRTEKEMSDPRMFDQTSEDRTASNTEDHHHQQQKQQQQQQQQVIIDTKQLIDVGETKKSDVGVKTNEDGDSSVELRPRIGREETDNKASRTTSADDAVDELSRIRANLRSNNARPVSTSRRFSAGAKQTTKRQ